ncbi:hypothetical protein FA15DRAFT_391072 [Coprinopsis marcescibilis]|uniref:Zn(2)-C6 fungal-type domain-containing protein n=1 Tax=Coprinopsis marcescibilis TaxID=230819 RepID=A0A5C3L9D9_COPMA|nr:hypothetical protein FA15DRAFT_391072 [Coprinopsis marcescibilis]
MGIRRSADRLDARRSPSSSLAQCYFIFFVAPDLCFLKLNIFYSDLLSRHVNKCHPEEKGGSASAASGRRKGTTSLSRATTSKQACDQCVQSSLPCDGSNPCAKCVQRKHRCTYVKFHRQTAPVGPGHSPGLSTSSGGPRAHSQDQRHPHHTPSVLSINGNLPALNIQTSSSLGHSGANAGSRYPSLYQAGSSGTSPADDFSYNLPPLSGYVPGGAADPSSLYGPSYTTAPSSARALDDDVYGSMNRPGTASSAGSSSASGHGHSGWTTSTSSGVYTHALERPLHTQPQRDHPYQHSGSQHQQHSSSSQPHWNSRIPSVVGAGVGAGGHPVAGHGGLDGYPPSHGNTFVYYH